MRAWIEIINRCTSLFLQHLYQMTDVILPLTIPIGLTFPVSTPTTNQSCFRSVPIHCVYLIGQLEFYNFFKKRPRVMNFRSPVPYSQSASPQGANAAAQAICMQVRRPCMRDRCGTARMSSSGNFPESFVKRNGSVCILPALPLIVFRWNERLI
jgi:hypothetical protein